MTSRKSPPQICAMCKSGGDSAYRTPLLLQQKIGTEEWYDAVFNKATGRWAVSVAATLMRWLCRTCWRSTKGMGVKQDYKPYRARRRRR